MKNRKEYPDQPDKWVELKKINKLPMPKIGDRYKRLELVKELPSKITKRGSRTHTQRRLLLKCGCGATTEFGLSQWGKSTECKSCANARKSKSREIAHTRKMLGKPLNPDSFLIVRARDWRNAGHVLCECTAPGCNNKKLHSISKTSTKKQLSCGCLMLRAGLDNPHAIDLTGTIHADGNVEILSLIGRTKDGDDFLWNALCRAEGKDCKGSFVVRGRSITSGKQISCGCIQRMRAGSKKRAASPVQIDTPLKGSYLIPREDMGVNRHNQKIWRCDCTYGGPGCVGTWVGTTGQISRRTAKSCGCLNNENLLWGGLRLKRCYEEPEFALTPRYIYLANFDNDYWKIGITDNPERRETKLYEGYEYISSLTTTGIAMAVERVALYRTKWTAPDPVPAKYRMEGGTEIRLKSKIDFHTLQRLLKDLQALATEKTWEKLIADEVPIGTAMEPIRYSDDDDEEDSESC